jgi:signal transduction histidine kinase
MNDVNGQIEEIGFSIDAGLIDRLGRELVGRAETAVSELIKNAYDADATNVDVDFIDTENSGGTLIISDNGVGMTKDKLVTGFMRISSSDKLENPISERYHRTKAGRKGIGRFATQRLGEELVIITQVLNESLAYKIVIEWNKYIVNKELTNIKFPITTIEKQKKEGTTIIIKGLRESWSENAIKRIYRYILDLLQPDYLQPKGIHINNDNLNSKKHQTFNVRFNKTVDSISKTILGKSEDVSEKALVCIEGYFKELDDNKGEFYYEICSKNLITQINDIDSFTIADNNHLLKNIHFRFYYFIYNPEHYNGNVSKQDLNNISKLSKNSGRIRLYRNGFRVLPYGEEGNDWLSLDIRYSGKSGLTNIPWSNNNFFGFVQITDKNGDAFEETASREGLIENKALEIAIEAIQRTLEIAKKRISSEINKLKTEDKKVSSFDKKIDDLEKKIDKQIDQITSFVDDKEKGKIVELKAKIVESFNIVKTLNQSLIDEISMLRILAGMGLTIGEFTHEIRNLTNSIRGYLSPLYNKLNDSDSIKLLDDLDISVSYLSKYALNFEQIISSNSQRELKPLDLKNVISQFSNSISKDLERQFIDFNFLFVENEKIYTLPMHESEWYTILLNMYTNSRKAIKMSDKKGEIKIVVGKNDNIAFLEFMDNGIGIKVEYRDRIFDAFFTTSTSLSENIIVNDLVGSGLGLKIVKDIIESYKGKIYIDDPESNFSTCFRIEIPVATDKQLDEYGY